nr:hypothetical protein [Tanacetum cinerariifolium]
MLHLLIARLVIHASSIIETASVEMGAMVKKPQVIFALVANATYVG